MPDMEITCAECGEIFPFTEREQEYYQERNLTHPKRCKPCRDARRSNFGGPKGGGGERQRFDRQTGPLWRMLWRQSRRAAANLGLQVWLKIPIVVANSSLV